MKFNTAFVNPFFINGFTWLLVFLVYQLRWSALCPRLSEEMLMFLFTTIVISFLCGFWVYKRGVIKPRLLEKVRIKSLVIWSLFFYLLLFVEAFVQGGTPLMSYVNGSLNISYKEFGLPVVHVLVVNGFSCVILYAFYSYVSVKNNAIRGKHLRLKLVLLIAVDMFAFILMFNRGALLANFAGIFLMMLAVSKKVWLLILKLTAIGLVILFTFGYMGNMRFGKDRMDAILKIGGITNEFRRSAIPSEFAWAYLYISTPLANTQNTINKNRGVSGDSEDLEKLITYEFTPEIISKRIGTDGNRIKSAKLIEDNLTVSSVYGRGYNYFGWASLWMIFGFIMLFATVNIKIIPQHSDYYFPMIVSLDIILIMNLFDNMLIFMGLVPQLFAWLILYLFERRSAIR